MGNKLGRPDFIFLSVEKVSNLAGGKKIELVVNNEEFGLLGRPTVEDELKVITVGERA